MNWRGKLAKKVGFSIAHKVVADKEDDVVAMLRQMAEDMPIRCLSMGGVSERVITGGLQFLNGQYRAFLGTLFGRPLE